MVNQYILTLLHSELPKLHGVLAVLSATGLKQVTSPQNNKKWLCIHIPYNKYETFIQYDPILTTAFISG